MKAKSLIMKFIFVFAISCICNGQQIGYVDISMEPKDRESAFEIACKFYGLEIERIPKISFENDAHIINLFNKKKFRAITIAASSLLILERTAQSNIFRVLRMQKIPLLIFGIGSNTNPDILSDWSQGSISECQNINRPAIAGYYQNEKMKTVTKQLSGIEFPYISNNVNNVNYLYCIDNKVKPIIQVSDATSPFHFPIFVKIEVEGQDIFFLTENQLNKTAEPPRGRRSYPKKYSDYSISRYDHTILQLLPFLIFLRYACNQMCWHSNGHYANLVIDDPWLKELYGVFNFGEILEQMKKCNFHTTIAFIPWNYDRSRPEVVNLFKRDPDRFSICLHGNNHDHKEFSKYETEFGDSLESEIIK
jgi:hypothetical protein